MEWGGDFDARRPLDRGRRADCAVERAADVGLGGGEDGVAAWG